MPWGRIDDKLHSNKKFAEVSLEATGLWLLCYSWCCDNLTDGCLSPKIIERYGGRNSKKLTKELVEAGLWEEHDGSLWVHDFLEYNDSKEEVLAERTKAKERMQAKRGGKKETGSPEQSLLLQSCSPEQSANIDGNSDSVNLPRTRTRTRTHPEKEDTPLPPTGEKARKRAPRERKPLTYLSEDWNPPPDAILAAEARYPNLDITAATEDFRNYYISQGKPLADWTAAWRNSMLKCDQKNWHRKSTVVPPPPVREPPKNPVYKIYNPIRLAQIEEERRKREQMPADGVGDRSRLQ